MQKRMDNGRRQSFGVWGIGIVSVSDAQDVDTAAGGMAFDRLNVYSSAGVPFLRSIKNSPCKLSCKVSLTP